jgi:hypothetical protein
MNNTDPWRAAMYPMNFNSMGTAVVGHYQDPRTGQYAAYYDQENQELQRRLGNKERELNEARQKILSLSQNERQVVPLNTDKKLLLV